MGQSLRKNERGGSRIRTLLALVIFGALIFSAIKIVPIYVANYQLQDTVKQAAQYAFNPNTGRVKSTDQIRGEIAQKVQELGVPVTPDQIRVTDDNGGVRISIDYTVSVNLEVYQLQLHFHPHADNTSI